MIKFSDPWALNTAGLFLWGVRTQCPNKFVMVSIIALIPQVFFKTRPSSPDSSWYLLTWALLFLIFRVATSKFECVRSRITILGTRIPPRIPILCSQLSSCLCWLVQKRFFWQPHSTQTKKQDTDWRSQADEIADGLGAEFERLDCRENPTTRLE